MLFQKRRIIYIMLWVLAGLELLLWIYGMATGHRMGGVLNFLLVLAAVAVVTELGLRWRRDRRIKQRLIAKPEPRVAANLPKAA